MEKERGAIPGLMVAKIESQSGNLRGVRTLHLKVGQKPTGLLLCFPGQSGRPFP